MLSDSEKREIEAGVKKYEHKRSACIDALKAVQRKRGWVDDGALKGVAEMLEMTPDELDSVATFYNLIFRRPVGEHVILVCNTVSCHIMGYTLILERIRERLKISLGETTDDKKFTLLPIPCLGACDKAPAMMIDDELYCGLTPVMVDEILERYGWKGV